MNAITRNNYKNFAALFVIGAFLLCFAVSALQLVDFNEMLDDMFNPQQEAQFHELVAGLLIFSSAAANSLVKASRVILVFFGTIAWLRPVTGGITCGSASFCSLVQQFNN